MRCPCRKRSETIAYDHCCRPFHDGTRAAPTAVALMRSRYTGFVLQRADYLLATWHPSTRPVRIEFAEGQVWLLLRVLSTTTEDDRATVAFVARSRIGGATHILEETSRFVRENGHWLYIDGVVTGG